MVTAGATARHNSRSCNCAVQLTARSCSGAFIESRWLVWPARSKRKSWPSSRWRSAAASRISAMLTRTRSRMSAMLARLAPASATMLSTSSTSAPSATKRRANAEPIRPTPPVIITCAPRKAAERRSEFWLTNLALVPDACGGRDWPEARTDGRPPYSSIGTRIGECSIGNRSERRRRGGPREQPFLDQLTDNVPERDVELLYERRRIRRRAETQIAPLRHLPAAFPGEADDDEAAGPRRRDRPEDIRRTPGGGEHNQHIARAPDPLHLALEH